MKQKNLRQWASRFKSRITQRCTNKNVPKYKYYGGRGIQNFLTLDDIVYLLKRDNAMNLKYASIDRINKDGHYELSNCRFIELSENSRRNIANGNISDKHRKELSKSVKLYRRKQRENDERKYKSIILSMKNEKLNYIVRRGGKLNLEKAEEIRKILKKGVPIYCIAKEYGVSTTHISQIKNNSIWKTCLK